MSQTPDYLRALTRPRLHKMMLAHYGRAHAHHPEGLPVWVEVYAKGQLVRRAWVASIDAARAAIMLDGRRVACPVGAIPHRYN